MLGSAVQREGEDVINFANRIRELGSRIIDAYRYENAPTATVLAEFNTETNRNMITCFKRGLQPRLEHRMQNNQFNTLGDAVKHAVKLEKTMARMEDLRKGINVLNLRDRERKKVFFVDQNEMEDLAMADELNDPTEARMYYNTLDQCQACSARNHRNRQNQPTLCKDCTSPIKHQYYENRQRPQNAPIEAQTVCQICTGPHLATICPRINARVRNLYAQDTTEEETRTQPRDRPRCQLCNRNGHVASSCFKYSYQKKDYNERTQQSCSICHRIGHTYQLCPQVQRNCTYCKMTNHNVDTCFKKERDERQSKNEFLPSEQGAPKATSTKAPHASEPIDPLRFIKLDLDLSLPYPSSP